MWSWEIGTYTDELHIYAGTLEGEKTLTIVDIVENKSNRSLNEQADLEAEQRINVKLRNGYHFILSEAYNSPKFKAMLAQKYTKMKHKVDFTNTVVQPKLDGRRLVAFKEGGEIKLFTRGNKQVTTLSHIILQLDDLMVDGDIFDGEAYIHGTPLQTVGSYITRKQSNTQHVEFHVFDKVSDLGFAERHRFFQSTTHIKYVPYHIVQSHEEIVDWQKQYVLDGYEGLMIRNTQQPYQFTRSTQLLKYKPFVDGEYLIVGTTTPTKGQDKGCIILICETFDGTRFKSIPKGSKAYRRKLYKQNNVVGKYATVRAAGYTLSGIPYPNPVTEEIDRLGTGDL